MSEEEEGLVLHNSTLDVASGDEDALMIDCEEDFDDDEDGYDPLSLVSVGLDEDDEDMDEDEDDFSIEESYSVQSCTFCSESFASRKLLNSHILSEHEKACSVACQYCGQVLSDGDSYRRHLDTVHQVLIPSLGDDVSPRKLLKSSKLKPFFSIPSLVRKCPDCDQQFANKTTLNIHRLKVHVAGLQNLPCPQCGQQATDLTAHMRRQHNVEGIVCPHCANIFSKKCTLNRHIEQVHNNNLLIKTYFRSTSIFKSTSLRLVHSVTRFSARRVISTDTSKLSTRALRTLVTPALIVERCSPQERALNLTSRWSTRE